MWSSGSTQAWPVRGGNATFWMVFRTKKVFDLMGLKSNSSCLFTFYCLGGLQNMSFNGGGSVMELSLSELGLGSGAPACP